MLLLIWYNTNMKNNHKNINSNEIDWQIIPTESGLHLAQEFMQIAAKYSAADNYSEKPAIIY